MSYTDINNVYKSWVENLAEDDELYKELKNLNKDQIEDAFYRDLSFGTGGLRGVIGVGTNRMNIYTIAKASKGLSNYLNNNFSNPSIVIGYDSRNKSDIFAKVASTVFSLNNIKVYIWPNIIPVPVVSFAIRFLNLSAGVMITASHNPSKYNGFKVYGEDGCQITTKVADEIQREISKLDIFKDYEQGEFEEELRSGKIKYIDSKVYSSYIECVKSQSVNFNDNINKNIRIVYSPLNGTGLVPVLQTLKEMGYNDVTVVKEQEQPDGNFPTCPYPNPEKREAMELGISYAKRINADLFIATDPDCDRVGIAVKNSKGQYELLTGNQLGILLLDYICSQRIKYENMPTNPVMIKTIVTSDMGERIASYYGINTINVLTGFKYIGEQIGKLEKKGRATDFIFGFEESFGYLTGTYVRDKDAVSATFLICEMFCYYLTKGISLTDKLNELYSKHGYFLDSLHTYKFEGSNGITKMNKIMQIFRSEKINFEESETYNIIDYSKGIGGLPKSNVIKIIINNNCSIVVRPSGTEPILKVYISIETTNRNLAKKKEKKMLDSIEKIIMD